MQNFFYKTTNYACKLLKSEINASRATHMFKYIHTPTVGDEASIHDMAIQTVCVSEHTASGYQITSLSKHEAFNRCETPGPGSFHTTESLLTQKNRRRKRTVQWMDERQKQWKKFHKRLYIYREGIKPKNMESDSIQTNSLRLNRKKVIGGGEKRFGRIFRLTYGVTFVAFWDLGMVVRLCGGWSGAGGVTLQGQ